jgi:hypothetical protein
MRHGRGGRLHDEQRRDRRDEQNESVKHESSFREEVRESRARLQPGSGVQFPAAEVF